MENETVNRQRKKFREINLVQEVQKLGYLVHVNGDEKFVSVPHTTLAIPLQIIELQKEHGFMIQKAIV